MAKLLLFLLGLLSYCVQLSLQQDCSATQLCAIGCCSKAGFCGFGPEFCEYVPTYVHPREKNRN